MEFRAEITNFAMVPVVYKFVIRQMLVELLDILVLAHYARVAVIFVTVIRPVSMKHADMNVQQIIHVRLMDILAI